MDSRAARHVVSVSLLFAGLVAGVRTVPTRPINVGSPEALVRHVDRRAAACRPLTIGLSNIAVAGALLAGMVTGGVSAVAGLFYIGWDLGLAMRAAVQGGMPAAVMLAALLPHGILELVAILLAGSHGMMGGMGVYRLLVRAKAPFKTEEWSALLQAAIVSAAMLAVAAVVECYMTPGILRWVLSS